MARTSSRSLLVRLAPLALRVVRPWVAWDTKGSLLTGVHAIVAGALFIASRVIPADVNTLPTIANDLLACVSGVLVLRWPTVGTAFYFLSFILSLSNLAESTPTALCIALVILSLTIRSFWAAGMSAVVYGVLLFNWHRPLAAVEIAFEAGLILAAFGFGVVLRRSRQLAAEQDARAVDEQKRLRLRLAHELHDSLARSHVLITLRLEAALADENLSEETREELLAAQKATVQAVADLGALVSALRSSGTNVTSIEHLPLTVEALLEEQFARLRAEGFEPEAHIPDDADSAEIAHLFAPVLIEATTNIIKHGTPGPCRFTLKIAEDTAMLVASSPMGSDDRQGNPGYGLLGIAERLTAIGGEATWHSRDGKWVLVAAAPLEPQFPQNTDPKLSEQPA